MEIKRQAKLATAGPDVSASGEIESAIDCVYDYFYGRVVLRNIVSIEFIILTDIANVVFNLPAPTLCSSIDLSRRKRAHHNLRDPSMDSLRAAARVTSSTKATLLTLSSKPVTTHSKDHRLAPGDDHSHQRGGLTRLIHEL